MTLPKRDYGDPLEVLLRKEAETCKGCTHEALISAFGSKYIICKLQTKRHGKRCDQYEEKA